MNLGCIIVRKTWMQPSRRENGRVIPTGPPVFENEICGTPLFTEREIRTSVCESCHEGHEYTVEPRNIFANNAEKMKAARAL